MSRPRLILVGGFLGAGKTTLLRRAADRFFHEGKRVGLVTNDQAADLVDTALLGREGLDVKEVAGGCFCCRFDNLLAACEGLGANRPDVILGEPVGSCVDISATVLQPLKAYCADRFELAPFSVLLDPQRLEEVLGEGGLSPFSEQPKKGTVPCRLADNVRYIMRKQLEEADLLVLNKADLLPAARRSELKDRLALQLPGTETLEVSALTGEGLDQWMQRVMAPQPGGGRKVAAIDYDTYAAGEAALGWLNASIAIYAAEGGDWPDFCRDFLRRLQRDCRERGADIAHVKLLLNTFCGSVEAHLTNLADSPVLVASCGCARPEAWMILNARVQTDPDSLRAMVEQALAGAAAGEMQTTIAHIESFSPARPQPVHRFGSVVAEAK